MKQPEKSVPAIDTLYRMITGYTGIEISQFTRPCGNTIKHFYQTRSGKSEHSPFNQCASVIQLLKDHMKK